MNEELSDDELILDCIGVDDRIHFCKANSDKTLCGIQVKRKKILKFDFDNFYSCSDCRW